MNQKGLEELRQQLLARSEELRQDVLRTQEQGRGERSGEGAEDDGDKATLAYEKEYLFHRSDESRQALLHVESALERMRRGSFGICDACGEEIEVKRLKALPWARYCLSCQDKKERGLLEVEQP